MDFFNKPMTDRIDTVALLSQLNFVVYSKNNRNILLKAVIIYILKNGNRRFVRCMVIYFVKISSVDNFCMVILFFNFYYWNRDG